MTWDDASFIMEHYVTGSANVKLLRLKRTGTSKATIGPEGLFKMTLRTTDRYREAAGHEQTVTIITVAEAEAWIAGREQDGSAEPR